MSRCRIGLLGAGGVARRHAGALATMEEVDLVAVADPDPDRRAGLAAELSAVAVADVGSLVDLELDAVYVCVPPFAHGEAEVALAGAGTHLFIEKPLGLDLAGARRVRAAVEDAGVLTAVGHHWRSSAAVQRAAELTAGRPVRLVTASWLDRVPPVPWWSRRSGSGGQVVEQAVHVLDLVRLLAGEVTDVHAVGDGAPPAPDADIDSATAAVLRLAGGGVGTLTATSALGWKQHAGIELYGDHLALSLTEEGLRARDGDGTVELAVDPVAARSATDRAFVDALLGRRHDGHGVLVDYAEALRTHRLACAVADSATANATGADHG